MCTHLINGFYVLKKKKCIPYIYVYQCYIFSRKLLLLHV